MESSLEIEIADALRAGMRQVSVSALDTELAELGYRRDLETRCTCVAKNMTTGNSYPCVTFNVKEMDSGMSAFNVGARRDSRFKALQALRFNTFAVSRGMWVSC